MSEKYKVEFGDCDCEGWKTSMKQINNMTIFAFAHRIIYTGKKFVYCPWCGNKRKIEEIKGK